MRRREFISLVGAMTAALPLVTRAHQAGMNRSGLLMSVAQTDLEETFSDSYRKNINISHKTTGTCHLTPEEFHTAYPKLRAWIQKTLESSMKRTRRRLLQCTLCACHCISTLVSSRPLN